MKSNTFALVFGEFETFICDNPSVKTVSQEPVLPAPLAQGSLRRSRARGFIDTLGAALCAARSEGSSPFSQNNLLSLPSLNSPSKPMISPPASA